ncbi:MAG TPA: ABC transporter permease [Natrialbaceae archaeon]|nr:ABC transporter permease [Natrialbaceae archaeon]
MSVTAVAKKDFQDAVRSRSLWALSVVFVGLAMLTTFMYIEFPELLGGEEELSGVGLGLFLAGIASLFIGLTAIVIAYKALAGERELGSMKLLLALPHTRADVVFGKVLGRTATLAIPIVLGFGAAGLYGYVMISEFSFVDYLIFLGLTVVFALAFVSIVVGISGSTGSTSRASALAVGFFLLFELIWDGVTFGLVYVTNGFALPETMPNWIYVVNQIPPSSAYTTAMMALIPDAIVMGDSAAQEIDAFYATEWLGVVMLVFWIVVPLAIGYRRFKNADL